MIAFIRGELAEVTHDAAVVDAGGVGYLVLMPARHLGQLPPVGEEVKIHTYMQVKEDDQQLFGFLTKEDLMIFKKVIGVSGIGPKGALSIMSQMTASELHLAVVSGDVKAISAAPGIGKKTAEKIVLELRDKFDDADLIAAAGFETMTAGGADDSSEASEAVQALVALGYGRSDAMHAVRRVEGAEGLSVEDLIRQALVQLI